MSDERDTLAIERLALGELTPAQAAALRARADVEPRLAELQRSNAEILAAHPPAAVRAEVDRRRARRSARPAVWLALPLAAAAAGVFVLWPGPADDAPRVAARVLPGDPGETRIKGLAPHLVVHRQEGERAVQLAEPADARAHDRLQISYVAAGASHGVVLSIDGAGVVTLHHPAHADASTALRQDGAVALPQSYELDAAPGFERFILVTAGGPLDAAQLLTAARDLAATPAAATAPLALPPGSQQASFMVRKVAQ